MLKELIKTKEWIIDVLMPKKCLGCGREGQYVCKNCEVFLSEVEAGRAEPCSIMSVWEYEGLVEKLIQKIKNEGCYDIIGELMEKAFEKIELDLPEDTIITFIPMYKKKEKRRGFNQAELIAKKVGEVTGKPVARLLDKIRDNRSQADLDPQARIKNVKNAFVSSSRENHRTILLVDDFYATGATMKECINILKASGAKNVFAFTLARQSVIQVK